MSTPRIEAVRVRALTVPLDPPLQTSAGDVPAAPLVLIDLRTESGVTGRSYLFGYTPLVLGPLAQLVRELVGALADVPATPAAAAAALEARFRLLRPQGLVTMAASGIDTALWDAVARDAGLPLVTVLGGRPEPVPAYASLRSMRPADAAAEAAGRADEGFTAYKVKVGLADVETDVEVVRAIRAAVGADARVAVDYNQSLSVAEAKRRLRVLADERLLWVEEPTAADDDPGHARIRAGSSVPVQLGESWWGVRAMAASIAAGASDLAMVDVTRIGGVTGWTQAAALAAAHGLPLSTHLFPEASAHLLPVSPTAHLLEHLDVAGPLLAEPFPVVDGALTAPDRPGTGVEWDEDAVARLEPLTLTWTR